ncbi:protein shortage in chiasmata 1 ortholog isoform X1 [Pygocentrus nattereri]|uniref:protein shortage in chiasmata 1 ortholog isoform X1 n=1 Tax=Pygocentrus nattereri TaxID=42514 RepID=UPI001890C461|nr:protein shortage in chiasmata 1 ortholog isoform X1 [Pygocentrus nattereri]
METDLILSPPDRPVLPEPFLSASQLAAESLSPVCRQVLLSDGDREAMEKAVWMAEKHPQCVAEFLLAEPQISSPSVRSQSLPELLSLLEAERETQSTDSLTNPQRLSTFTLLPQKPTQWSLTEPMTVEQHTVADTGKDPAEQFSLLSLIQIDELLKTSAERAVQDLPVSVREGSVHSKAVLTSVPSRVEAGKAVKFMLLEEAPQKQSTISESRETATEPAAANEFLPNDTRSGVISSTPISTENLNHLSENTPKKEDSIHLKTDLNQLPHTPAERHGGIPSKTPLDPPDDLEVAKVTPVEQKLEESLTSTASVSLAQSVRQGGESEPNPAALQSSWRSFSVSKPQEDLDPLSSFIMLRTVQRSLVVQKPPQIPLNTAVADPAQKYMREPTPVLGVSEKAKNSKASLGITEKAFSKTIYVQATENERFAYFELHALARPSLRRVRELDQNALRRKDFTSLTPEDTRFYLKQQEKLLSMSRGRECVYDDMALLHILVRVKELLLRCDLTTAIDYMEEAQSTCSMGGLKELLRRLQVLQYVTYRKEEQEPSPRVLHLQEQMSTYLQRNTSNTVLVVAATERVRAELVTALSQVPGSCVSTVLPGGLNKVDSRTVIDSLSCSRSVIVCRQQIGSDFPWQKFSVVLELDSLCHSTISSFCSQNNVNYICFCTATPKTEAAVSPQAYLDSVPFLVFVTEGLLKHSDLLHLLESTYNMTLLERSYSQSMQKLESPDRYDVITVDEKTAILLQDLEELQREKASNSVVIRLSALSLQFTRCWIILHCGEQHSKLVYGDTFNNLVLIYSSFVLFGLKSEDLDVKVFLVRDVADIAWYVYQICLHTLLSSEKSVWSWLDRDWFSVLQTEEESCLVCFPCINPLVSQLMLRRAPSLQWLLEASFSELKDKFPEIPHKVCKLFSDVTALHRLSAAPSKSEPENAAPLQSNDNLCPPHPQLPHWAVNGDEPHSDSLTDTQLFLTSSSTELSSPESVQQQGAVDTGWRGTVGGASVGQSECACNSHLQPWPGEPAQNERNADSFGDGEDQWTVDASSLSAPDLSYSHTHILHTECPAPAVLLGQISPVEETEMLPPPLWRSSACGTSSRGQQSNAYSISPQYQQGAERKRPARDAAGETVFPQCKRGRLLFERIPGRCDGQTRLRFF